MITEDYVSFETAKLLKEKGFDGILPCVYIDTKSDKKPCLLDTLCNYNDGHIKDVISAPTLQMAMKWLREVHGIHIQAYCPVLDLEVDITRVKYNAVISNLKGYCIAFDTDIEDKEYDSPEEAYEAAIRYCLENLI